MLMSVKSCVSLSWFSPTISFSRFVRHGIKNHSRLLQVWEATRDTSGEAVAFSFAWKMDYWRKKLWKGRRSLTERGCLCSLFWASEIVAEFLASLQLISQTIVEVSLCFTTPWRGLSLHFCACPFTGEWNAAVGITKLASIEYYLRQT